MDKRILYIIPSLTTGGAEHQTINQLNHLHASGIDVHLIVLSDQVPLINQLDLDSSRVHILGIPGLVKVLLSTISSVPMGVFHLRKLIIKLSPSIVLAILPLSHLLARLVAPLTPAHKLWIYHRSMQYEANPLNTPYKKMFHELVVKLSKKYDYGHIYISEAVKQNIQSLLPTDRNVVLHNAVPYSDTGQQFAVNDLARRNINSWDYLVVVPGRIHSSKGQVFFLRAVQEVLRAQNQTVMVLFVGGGPDESKLRAIVEDNGLTETVVVTGMVQNDLLLSYLKLSDLTVIPSVNEGFGNVAIEGLMQGATMLSSDAGGLKEIINDGLNGFLFRRLDKDHLREKLQSIINNKLKIPPAKLHSEYLEKFTTKAQVDRLLKILFAS